MKGYHRQNGSPLKREGIFQRQTSHLPQGPALVHISPNYFHPDPSSLPFSLFGDTACSCRPHNTRELRGLVYRLHLLSDLIPPRTSCTLLALNSILMTPNPQPRPPHSLTPRFNYLTDISTQVNDGHLKLNIPAHNP